MWTVITCASSSGSPRAMPSATLQWLKGWCATARASLSPTVCLVDAGFIKSLAKPGGNITGVSILSPELATKKLDILKEIVPAARRFVVLTEPALSSPKWRRAIADSAHVLGIELPVGLALDERASIACWESRPTLVAKLGVAMPIKPEMRGSYPLDWPQISRRVRFERADGICQGCGRPHGATVRCLPDGRWFDATRHTWRNGRGRPARWPDLDEAARMRQTRVFLAAAHLDHDPSNNRLRNLKSLCQRCHLIHDRPHHLAQRRITYMLRRALGDLFLGPYPVYFRLQKRAHAAVAVNDVVQ